MKKVRDPGVVDGCRYVMIGRGRQGHRLSMVGKVVRVEGKAYWKVITIHRAA